MTLPVGVTTCLVFKKAPVSFGGTAGGVEVEITPSVRLVHSETGTPLVDFIESVSPADGSVAQMMLPHTSQAGFQDEAGNAFTNWHYTARVRLKKTGHQPKVLPLFSFQIPAGQTEIDLSLVPAGPASLPTSAPIAVVTSVAGFTGPVTGAQIAADPALSATIGLAIAGKADAVTVTTKTVKTDGTGQYLSPKLANDSITDASATKQYVILVDRGEYKDSFDWVPKPYVTVRGIDRDTCILSYSVPADSPDAAVRDRSVITLTKTASLENLTIAIEGGRYAIHSEEAGANQNALHNVRNCRFIHRGYDLVNAWRLANPGSGLEQWTSSQAAWGAGTGSGVEETFEGSAFESRWGPFYWHNSPNASPDKPTLGRMTRSRVTTEAAASGGVTLNSLGSGQADSFVFTDCQLDTMFVYHTDTSWFKDTYANHCDIRITLDRCNPVGYLDDSRGLALRVLSGFGDPGVKNIVRMSGTAVPIIFGVPTYRDGTGDAGYQGIAYGSQDISGITLGFTGSVGDNTLGKKLGNRTGNPVTISVWNQSFVQSDYTFNTDYTNMTNAEILTLLNAATPAFAWDTYNPANEVYPAVLGSESKLMNTGDGIAQWSAVAWNADRRSVRPMATGDDVELFAGVALERIPKNTTGRVLHEGVMNKSQLLNLTAGGFTAGATLYHSDTTAGQFATTGTRAALTARHADWAYFKANK